MKRIFLISISLGIFGFLIMIQAKDDFPLRPEAKAESDSMVLQNLNYTYDSVGNILEINDQSDLPTRKKITYAYDDLNRLLSAQTSGFSQGDYTQTFQYDPIGNMTYKSNVGSMIYNGTGFPNPHAITEVAGKKYTYDKNGNVTSDGEKSYTWNILNQLTSVTFSNGTIMEYTYNPFGQRLTSMNLKTGEKTIYVNKFMEIRPKSTIYYIWAGNQRVAQVEVPKGKTKEEGILTYLHEDHLGGTVVSTDEKGKVVAVYDYDPYGTQILSKSDSTTQVPYSFTGKEYEKNTGLYYFGARYYDPKVGRFVSEDPVAMNQPERLIGDPQAFNSYAYARNNPVNMVDPDGELFRKVWEYLSQRWDANAQTVSAFMLRHALEDNPSKLVRGNDALVATKIRGSEEFESIKTKIANMIGYGEYTGIAKIEGTLNDFGEGKIAFESDSDLNTSMHGIKGLNWNATKNEDGTYNVNITIIDIYDFEWDWLPENLTKLGVNGAVIDQALGVINTYDIEINMQETIKPTQYASPDSTRA